MLRMLADSTTNVGASGDANQSARRGTSIRAWAAGCGIAA